MRTFHLSDCFRVALLSFLALLILILPAQLAAAQTALPWPPGGTPSTVVVTLAPPGTPTAIHHMNRAGLVISHGDGSVQTRCVHFTGDYIGGDDLLSLSGLSLEVNSEGAVCAIGGEGCPADDCFCQCPFPDCEYWAYYHLSGTAWRYSEVGPYGWMIHDGAVDGWAWGPGDFTQGVLPPVIPFEQICPANALTPHPTPTRNYTPTPHATFTPAPTATATPIPPPPPAEIPEPATLLLLAPGLVALGLFGSKARMRRG
jgi:hypothetical protein